MGIESAVIPSRHHYKVNARLVRLPRALPIPPPLKYLYPGVSQFSPFNASSQINSPSYMEKRTHTIPSPPTPPTHIRQRNIKLRVIHRQTPRKELPLIRIPPRPHHQAIPHNLIPLRINNTHVRTPVMRDRDLHLYPDALSRRPDLRLVQVIRKLDAATEPEVAGGGVEPRVRPEGELGQTLDVGRVVADDGVGDGFAAGGRGGRAGLSGGGLGDVAVG